jgi:hypothetical protein
LKSKTLLAKRYKDLMIESKKLKAFLTITKYSDIQRSAEISTITIRIRRQPNPFKARRQTILDMGTDQTQANKQTALITS